MAKIISIITVVTLTALGFWITAETWVNSPIKFADWHVWIMPAILLVLLGTFASLAYMLLPQKRLKLLVSVLIAATFLAVFGFWYLDMIAFFLILLFHVLAIRNIQIETQDRLKIHIGQVIKRGIGAVMVPLYIALSFGFYSSPSIQTRAKDPNLAPNLKQIVVEVVDKFLANEIELLPEYEREQTSNYVIERTYNYITSYFDPYRQYFPPILAFGLFLILLGLGFILHRLCAWLGMAVFLLLTVTKFIKIEQKKVDAEVITLWQKTTTIS